MLYQGKDELSLLYVIKKCQTITMNINVSLGYQVVQPMRAGFTSPPLSTLSKNVHIPCRSLTFEIV